MHLDGSIVMNTWYKQKRGIITYYNQPKIRVDRVDKIWS